MNSPWYPLTARDLGQTVEVKWCDPPGCYIFKIIEGGQTVDAGGLDNGIRHVAQLLDHANYCVAWESEAALMPELASYDRALRLVNRSLRPLLSAAIAA